MENKETTQTLAVKWISVLVNLRLTICKSLSQWCWPITKTQSWQTIWPNFKWHRLVWLRRSITCSLNHWTNTFWVLIKNSKPDKITCSNNKTKTTKSKSIHQVKKELTPEHKSNYSLCFLNLLQPNYKLKVDWSV